MNYVGSKRTLEYWENRLRDVYRAYCMLLHRGRSAQEYYEYRIKPYKLKRQYGHALNRDYTGYKIPRRRDTWLKNRVIQLTKAASYKKEAARLKKTKISFYIAKIESLGGTVDTTRYWI